MFNTAVNQRNETYTFRTNRVNERLTIFSNNHTIVKKKKKKKKKREEGRFAWFIFLEIAAFKYLLIVSENA